MRLKLTVEWRDDFEQLMERIHEYRKAMSLLILHSLRFALSHRYRRHLATGCDRGAGNANARALRLVGSGATVPFPLYSAWFRNFGQHSSGVTVDFQAKGSGAGIQDLINRTVDFAASDAAMTPEQMNQVEGGAVLLPMTAGEIVIAYNLPGQPKDLKLPRSVFLKYS